MRKKGAGRKQEAVVLEIQAVDGVVEVTAAWVEDKRARFPGADVLAVIEAYRVRCSTDPGERVTVWGMERQLTRLIREQGRGGGDD
jgi:hypothetical protein